MCRTRGDLHCDASSNSADNLWYEKDGWLRCGRSTGDQALLAGRGRLPKKKSILCRRWHGSRYLCTYLWLSGTPQIFYLENGPKFFHETFRICRGSDCPHGIYNGKNLLFKDLCCGGWDCCHGAGRGEIFPRAGLYFHLSRCGDRRRRIHRPSAIRRTARRRAARECSCLSNTPKRTISGYERSKYAVKAGSRIGEPKVLIKVQDIAQNAVKMCSNGKQRAKSCNGWTKLGPEVGSR